MTALFQLKVPKTIMKTLISYTYLLPRQFLPNLTNNPPLPLSASSILRLSLSLRLVLSNFSHIFTDVVFPSCSWSHYGLYFLWQAFIKTLFIFSTVSFSMCPAHLNLQLVITPTISGFLNSFLLFLLCFPCALMDHILFGVFCFQKMYTFFCILIHYQIFCTVK